MQTPRLIFHPSQTECYVEPESLIGGLRDIGLLGPDRGDSGTSSFFAGERFLELLTFLGCSPVINLSPEDGERYCYIDIDTYDAPQFIYGSQPFQPRCRHCRSPIPDWHTQYTSSQSSSDALIHCDQCGQDSSLAQLNWKHSAGIGRQMVIIHNIYLHEAVPGEELLQTLEGLSKDTSWNYFYAL